MTRQFKTGRNNRANYVYSFAGGNADGSIPSKVTVTPNDTGVTEVLIASLHKEDDDTFNADRREAYKTVANYAEFDKEGNPIPDDQRSCFIDSEANPETQHIAGEDERTRQAQLAKLTDKLIPNLSGFQKVLYRKKFVENKSNCEIARETGRAESTIRGHLDRMYKALRKQL